MPARKPEEEREILKWIEDVMEEPVPKVDYEEVRPDNEILKNCRSRL